MDDFEKNRIKVLQQERADVQKKTFIKWYNSYLSMAGMEINNLFKDLEDGKRLIKLLEIISGEDIGKPNAGKLRVQKIENVNRVLQFLMTKVRLESIGAEDIVDGNPRLILGLIWTIILRFQIQDIEFETVDQPKEKKKSKEALLLWCQTKTAGYPGVRINDFTGSWRSGLAFNALLHAQKNDIFDYNKLNPNDFIANLNNAFSFAHRVFDIPKLLDAEDVAVERPDEKSILTYVSAYYHKFTEIENKGLALNKLGSNYQANECDDKALRTKPDDYIALVDEGNTLYKLCQYERAIKCYERALRVKPEDLNALNSKGKALKYLGRNEEALECFERALRIKPDCYEALNNKGVALQNLGFNEKALECYEKALEIKPDFELALNNKQLVIGKLEKVLKKLSLDEKRTFDVFICYSWKDKDYVIDLFDILMNCGFKCCVNFKNETKSDVKTQNLILSSRLFLMFVSKSFLDSDDCLNLSYFAINYKPDKLIFPIKVFQNNDNSASRHKLFYLLGNKISVENVLSLIQDQDSSERALFVNRQEEFLNRLWESLK